MRTIGIAVIVLICLTLTAPAAAGETPKDGSWWASVQELLGGVVRQILDNGMDRNEEDMGPAVEPGGLTYNGAEGGPGPQSGGISYNENDMGPALEPNGLTYTGSGEGPET